MEIGKVSNQVCLTIAILVTLSGNAVSHPMFVKAKFRRSVMSQRELVKRLQLQSLLKHLEGTDSDLKYAAVLDEDYRKRAAENEVFFPDRVKTEIAPKVPSEVERTESTPKDTRSLMDKRDGEGYKSQSKIPWDIINRNVPFNAPANKNTMNKRGAPCRRRRSTDGEIEKRHLKTPPGEGLVPQYNLYDEICEDSQPVEVVKIKKLIVEDGVIKDNDIVEPSMLQ